MARRPPVADRLRQQAARVKAVDAVAADVLDEGAAEIELLRAQLAGLGVLAIGTSENLLGPSENPPDR